MCHIICIFNEKILDQQDLKMKTSLSVTMAQANITDANLIRKDIYLSQIYLAHSQRYWR